MARLNIIMPVYNAEDTLEKAIKSVLQQSFSDLNLILVDDGSTDESLSICESLANSDSRIRVIHQANAGPSAARNVALESAEGEYVAFVDADDYLDPMMYQILLDEINKVPSSMAVCGYQREFCRDGSLVRIQKVMCSSQYIDTKKQLRNSFNELYLNNYFHLVWNKIYSLKVIQENHIRFKESLCNGEDLLFNLDYLSYEIKICICENVLYHYVSDENGSSLSNRNNLYLLDNKALLYTKVHNFLIKDLGAAEDSNNNFADSDIFLRDCFQIIDTLGKDKDDLQIILNHPSIKIALKSRGCGNIEFLLYRKALLSQKSGLIFLVSSIRLIGKRILRGKK